MTYMVIEILNDREKRTNAEIGHTISQSLPAWIEVNGSMVGNIDNVIAWAQRRKKGQINDSTIPLSQHI